MSAGYMLFRMRLCQDRETGWSRWARWARASSSGISSTMLAPTRRSISAIPLTARTRRKRWSSICWRWSGRNSRQAGATARGTFMKCGWRNAFPRPKCRKRRPRATCDSRIHRRRHLPSRKTVSWSHLLSLIVQTFISSHMSIDWLSDWLIGRSIDWLIHWLRIDCLFVIAIFLRMIPRCVFFCLAFFPYLSFLLRCSVSELLHSFEVR